MSENRDKVNQFKQATGCDSADEAIETLLQIAADEGYWNGEGDAAVVSVGRVEEIEQQVGELAEGFVELRDEMREHHPEAGTDASL